MQTTTDNTTGKTFREIAQDWLRFKRLTAKPSTILTYKSALRGTILPYFGERTAISVQDLQDFILDHPQKSRHSLRDATCIVKQICNYGAQRDEFVFVNKTIGRVTLQYPPQSAKRVETMSPSDARKLHAYCVEHLSAFAIGVLLSLHTGMRIGEVCALRWEDVDLRRGEIHIRQTLSVKERPDTFGSVAHLGTPKTTNSIRDIPMTPPLLEVMRTYKKEHMVGDFVCGVRTERGRYSAEAGTATHSATRCLREAYYSMLKRLGIPRIGFHGLRHTFATRAIESGVDAKVVSAILGHANVGITLNLYVHPSGDQKKRAVDKLAKYMGY